MNIYGFYRLQRAEIVIFQDSESVFANDFYLGVRTEKRFINLK